MDFKNVKELLALCACHNLSISQVMMNRECDVFETTKQKVEDKLKRSLCIMRDAIDKALKEDIISMGGLLHGESKKLDAYLKQSSLFANEVSSKAAAYALGVIEVNASMGLIVAAPTAGSSGVLPGGLFALQEKMTLSEQQLRQGLLNASAIGYLITRNANVSGAQGGCQAEVGSAAAMSASMICELLGGTPTQCTHAASHALMNLLGLVCDPICGLVEVPCQTRNAIGASNAFVSAQLALSGVVNILPLDEMIQVMDNVGKALPHTLRETALGGSAVAPSACKKCAK